jgi:hypothetical protein
MHTKPYESMPMCHQDVIIQVAAIKKGAQALLSKLRGFLAQEKNIALKSRIPPIEGMPNPDNLWIINLTYHLEKISVDQGGFILWGGNDIVRDGRPVTVRSFQFTPAEISMLIGNAELIRVEGLAHLLYHRSHPQFQKCLQTMYEIHLKAKRLKPKIYKNLLRLINGQRTPNLFPSSPSTGPGTYQRLQDAARSSPDNIVVRKYSVGLICDFTGNHDYGES